MGDIALIKFRHKGGFKNVEKFFKRVGSGNYESGIEHYAQMGVDALKAATPTQSGETASSWFYTITREEGHLTIEWDNSNVNDHVNIALILQLGHGTGTGGYFSGVDYINPALKPIFDEIATQIWKEVTGNA